MDIWLMWTYQCTIAQQILVNEVKLCTLKVQHDVQLAMAKFCWSTKDCQSQASFNDSTIKGLGQKILAYRVLVGGLGYPPSRLCPPPSRPRPAPQKCPENNKKTMASSSRLSPPSKSCAPTKISRKQMGQQRPMFLKQWHIVKIPPWVNLLEKTLT